MLEPHTCIVQICTYKRCCVFVNSEDVCFDHACIGYPSLTETTMLCEVCPVPVGLYNDVIICVQP